MFHNNLQIKTGKTSDGMARKSHKDFACFDN